MSNHHDYKLKVTRIGLLKHFSLWKSRFKTRNIEFSILTWPPQSLLPEKIEESLVKQNKLDMIFNETNVVEEWNKWFPETVEDNVSDNDTESDVGIVTELPFIQEKLRIFKEKIEA